MLTKTNIFLTITVCVTFRLTIANDVGGIQKNDTVLCAQKKLTTLTTTPLFACPAGRACTAWEGQVEAKSGSSSDLIPTVLFHP